MEINEKVCIEVQSRGVWHLLPMDRIAAVIPAPVIVKVPEAPKGVAGISVYEGHLVTYYTLEEQEEAGNEPEDARCGIIMQTQQGYCGVIAEEIAGQHNVPAEEYEKQMTENLKKIFGEQSCDKTE